MKFSIIIPTYNRSQTIQRAINSILMQSFKNWELIIIDDGSTDNTKEIIQKFKDKRIIYFKLNKNKGVNFARNKGIEKAKGEWILFLDSDDEYLDNSFNVILGILSNIKKNIDVVGFLNKEKKSGLIKDRKNFITESKWEKYYPTYEDVVLKRCIFGDIHHVIRKEVFRENFIFPERINGLESLFFSELIKNNKKFVYINKIVVLVYSDSGERLSTDPYLRWPEQFIWGYKKFVKDHYAILKKYPNRLTHYYLRIAKCYLKIKKPIGIWWLFRAFLLSPNDFLIILKDKIKN